MYNSISLDPNTSRLCQLETSQWRRHTTPKSCLNISNHLKEYLQIEHDNPNLIWLYTLMLENELDLPEGEIIEAMKQRLLKEDYLPPLAWRYIANGTADDFRIVLDSHDPGNTPNWQWKNLIHWLEILTGLRRNTPIPVPIQGLFLDDSLLVLTGRGVLFHSAWIHFDTLRHILEEAENRLMDGTFIRFAETDLIEVLTWLGSTNSAVSLLDDNQRKNGWNYLSKSAEKWKVDIVRRDAYQKLKWHSVLPTMQIDDWTIYPVVDAWSIYRLAISQHHCGDRYIDGCLKGKERIFVIRNMEDKMVASLRLTFHRDTWVLADIKGFANSEVSENIRWIGEEIARCYGNRPRHISAKSNPQAINI